MTKFILHGGRTSKPVVSNKRFFREIVKSLKEPVKILMVCFAKEKNEWEESFEKDREKRDVYFLSSIQMTMTESKRGLGYYQ